MIYRPLVFLSDLRVSLVFAVASSVFLFISTAHARLFTLFAMGHNLTENIRFDKSLPPCYTCIN